ncbi:uncharacterized protein UBRO_20512 [Ustilago bromivora]|uniref:Uncharacterized protein n=1 Tax=Ustilago bromivora TaxID=307758 RepID=A0A1K0FZ36_9BASI|nr:uncharacterized protein UBRO_20512 [Ustilago bromivora]
MDREQDNGVITRSGIHRIGIRLGERSHHLKGRRTVSRRTAHRSRGGGAVSKRSTHSSRRRGARRQGVTHCSRRRGAVTKSSVTLLRGSRSGVAGDTVQTHKYSHFTIAYKWILIHSTKSSMADFYEKCDNSPLH